jgi:hypothetical protein
MLRVLELKYSSIYSRNILYIEYNTEYGIFCMCIEYIHMCILIHIWQKAGILQPGITE